jgi:hypothetical protein
MTFSTRTLLGTRRTRCLLPAFYLVTTHKFEYFVYVFSSSLISFGVDGNVSALVYVLH